MVNRRDRIAGGLLGMLVGDALGVPYEFRAAASIPAREEIEYAPPAGYHRAHARVKPGTWSDDGAQALCLLSSLLDCGRLDLEDFGKRLVSWMTEGYMAVGGDVFDVGGTTAAAIRSLKRGTPALSAGPRSEIDNGNGSLMRVLPLALWHRGSDEELFANARAQSCVTHGHLRAQLCCGLYCLWARNVLNENADAWNEALAAVKSFIADDALAQFELEFQLQLDSTAKAAGSGYVVDCLRSALWVHQEASYEDVVRAAIQLGDDTDTTACVSGGIAGLRFGVQAIPERWVQGLRGRELYEPLLDRLLAMN